jgi:hypothetical protein
VRLDSFIGQYTTDWQHPFGASVVATIPISPARPLNEHCKAGTGIACNRRSTVFAMPAIKL